MAATTDKGIERLLSSAAIGYRSLPELGNVFLQYTDWRKRYTALMHCAGHLLVTGLDDLEGPFCLLCVERKVSECHRLQIAAFLASRGFDIEHLE